MGVMGGGVLLNLLSFYHIRSSSRSAILSQKPIKISYGAVKENHNITTSLVVGSLLFGCGWGLAGFCPGPAIASLGAHLGHLMFHNSNSGNFGVGGEGGVGGGGAVVMFMPCLLLGMLLQDMVASTMASFTSSKKTK